MSDTRTPDEITAAIQGGMAGRIYEEQQAQTQDTTTRGGDHHGVSGGTVHGDLNFTYKR